MVALNTFKIGSMPGSMLNFLFHHLVTHSYFIFPTESVISCHGTILAVLFDLCFLCIGGPGSESRHFRADQNTAVNL